MPRMLVSASLTGNEIDEIDKLVIAKVYLNRADFVRTVIREELKRIKKSIQKSR